MGIITARKSEDFGCVVQLDYEKIINSNDVVTGAVLSDFDRCVYDAVVTIFVAGNDTFTTNDIWRIISHNPNARITPNERDKIIRSMFHISRFWMSIITDDSEKYETWFSLNRNSTFSSERKIYKRLLSSYTGRLLDFCVIGNVTFDVSYEIDGQEVTAKQSFAQVWKILNTPILYKYAKDKSQVSSVPLQSRVSAILCKLTFTWLTDAIWYRTYTKLFTLSLNLLDTSKKPDKKHSLKRGSHNDELAHFLSREIDTMKKTAKRKKSYSHSILLERIYQIDGIDDIQQSKNDLKQKKFVTRKKVEKILCRFKENNMIVGFIFHKKTIAKTPTFYSLEIFI